MKDMLYYCDCGCKTQLLIVDFVEEKIEFNIRIDGRRRWLGVVLNKNQIKKLEIFIDKKMDVPK